LDLSFSKHLNVVQAEAGGNFLGARIKTNRIIFLNRVFFKSKRMRQIEKAVKLEHAEKQ
jgi:hypothetical protein